VQKESSGRLGQTDAPQPIGRRVRSPLWPCEPRAPLFVYKRDSGLKKITLLELEVIAEESPQHVIRHRAEDIFDPLPARPSKPPAIRGPARYPRHFSGSNFRFSRHPPRSLPARQRHQSAGPTADLSKLAGPFSLRKPN